MVEIRLKRRPSGGAAGVPSSLKQAEPFFNEADQTLSIGVGSSGANGTASSIIPIGGPGAFVDRNSAQTIAGVKSFNAIPNAPTPAPGDSSTNVATTAFVTTATTLPSVGVNTVHAGPASGSASAQPTYRLLQPADIPIITADKVSDFSAAADARVNAQKGVANGLAYLDSAKLIPSVLLPSYVDDVLEFASQSAFPATGEKGKIYVALDTNRLYRWGDTIYVETSPSPGSTDGVPEGSVNLYFTSQRVLQTVLSGLTMTSSAVVAASDSVLNAIGKLQAQVSARLVSANNLSDLTSVPTARTNLGLGTMAVQNAAAVAITGGTIDGVTLDGGVA